MANCVATTIAIPTQLPFWQAICWQIKDTHSLTPQEMLRCYERGWRYRDTLGNLDWQEKVFAMLRLQGELPTAAIEKAAAAYPVIEPLKRAIAAFQQQPEYRDRGYDLLQVTDPVQVINGLDQLATDVGLKKTKRGSKEK